MDRSISDHVLRMHRYTIPGQEGTPLSFEVSSTDQLRLASDATANADGADSIFQKFDPLLHGSHRTSAAAGNGFLTLDFLKKYIYYAKTRFQPVLTDAAIDLIAEGYAELRSQQNARTLPVTARSLETLIRIASAHAKARLNKVIERRDAERAMQLMSFALYHEASESATEHSIGKLQPSAEETVRLNTPTKVEPVVPGVAEDPAMDKENVQPTAAVQTPSRKRDRSQIR